MLICRITVCEWKTIIIMPDLQCDLTKTYLRNDTRILMKVMLQ